MDVAYTKVNNKSKIGEGANWLELLGCGMINPIVLANCKIDSKKYQGFAFGMGIERMAKLSYEIEDMRSLFSNDIKFLSQ